jgi:hypothetical protein
MGVAQIVEANPSDTVAPEKPLELARDRVGIVPAPVGSGEDEVMAVVGRAPTSPLELLGSMVIAHDLQGDGIQPDRSAAGVALRRAQILELVLSVFVLQSGQLLLDRDDTRAQVYVPASDGTRRYVSYGSGLDADI